MIKMTVFGRDEHCTELVSVVFSHITMFDENKLDIRFIHPEEQIKLVTCLIKQHAKFTCEGQVVSFPVSERQRLRYRFDAVTN